MRTVTGLPAEGDRSRGGRFDAEKSKPDIGPSGADKARETQHLAAMKIEADAFEYAPPAQIRH